MLLTDTHTHLYSKSFDPDRDEMVQRAIAAGVELLLLPNIDKDSIETMLELADRYPKHCFPMMGLHPGSVEDDYLEQLALHRSWLDKRPFIAVGEIGIDLYWRQDNLKAQEEAFLTQVSWAIDLDLPIVIHSRESCSLILDLLKGMHVRGVFHCFTGTTEEAKRITDMGMYLGIGGVITYKANDTLRDVVKQIPLERILLETDSPYLPPVPYRGKRNESSYLPLVAEQLCSLYGKGMQELAEITTNNAKTLFRL
jgi:TatD DNase family protein